MAQAKKTSSIEGWGDKKASDKAKRDREQGRIEQLSSKTFEQLSAKQKDLLLKVVGVRLGLIEESDDEE